MGKQTLLEKFQDAISWYIGWLYLWSLRMTVEEYVSSVIAENAQQSFAADGARIAPFCSHGYNGLCPECDAMQTPPRR